MNALLLPLATQAMDQPDKEIGLGDLLREFSEEFACLPIAFEGLDSVTFPRRLNSDDIQNIISGKGTFMSPSGHKLLLASINPGTGNLSQLTSTAYLESFRNNLCAYRVCFKTTYQHSSADAFTTEEATAEDCRNAFEETIEKKVPKDISDIKLKTGFDQLEVAPKVTIQNPMSFKAAIRMYQLYFPIQTPNHDPVIGQFALVFMKHQNNGDLATYQPFLKEEIIGLHKLLEHKLRICPHLLCDLDDQDLSFQ